MAKAGATYRIFDVAGFVNRNSFNAAILDFVGPEFKVDSVSPNGAVLSIIRKSDNKKYTAREIHSSLRVVATAAEMRNYFIGTDETEATNEARIDAAIVKVKEALAELYEIRDKVKNV